MTFAQLMAKEHHALESARLLPRAGDADGACNRAYYAMFDSARAALAAGNPTAEMAAAKSSAAP